MVKSRMTTADVAAEVACLRARVTGMRLANVYDDSAKMFTMKLAKSGEAGEKVMVVIESGTRFHTTQVATDRASSDMPGNFTMKLRKHLRAKRLADVRQLGIDRIVDFTFGHGDSEHHLILELYSQGNVVLTDREYVVLSLLRSHRDDEKNFALMPGHPYPVHACRLRRPASREELQTALQEAAPDGKLRDVLQQWLPYGPALAEHLLLEAELKAVAQTPLGDAPVSEGQLDALMTAVDGLEAWFDAAEVTPPPGFICLKGPRSGSGVGPGGAAAPLEVYEEYGPLVLAQHRRLETRQLPTFDDALSEFYSKIDQQKAEQAQAAHERAALARLDKVKSDQTKRVAALEAEAEAQERRALLIHLNLEAVEGAIAAVNGALAAGMDWGELEAMIRAEKRAGNPVASIIGSLALDRNKVTLMLAEPQAESSESSEDDSDDGDAGAEVAPRPRKRSPRPVGVEVDLSLSAHANASVHHGVRKKHEEKHRRTVQANQSTFKAAEKKALQQVQQAKSVASIRTVRKVLWFEKFHWFITSENYLVLTGRDAQQNELLVKRYLRRGDIYVHADLHGASTTIVKNPRPDEPVPPLTITQAGCTAVCRSRAWDAKIVTSAWWVHHHQVSKTAPTGEYLPTGSFMVRGKKNFLPPSQLVMGLGMVFKLDDSSVGAHIGERPVRGAVQEEEEEGAAAAGGGVASEAGEPHANGDEGGADGREGAKGGVEDLLGDADGGPAAGEQEESGGEEEGEGEGEEEGEGDELDAYLDSIGAGVGGLTLPATTKSAAQGEEGISVGASAAGKTEPRGGGGAKHLSASQRKAMKKAGLAAPTEQLLQQEAVASKPAGPEDVPRV
eukprot:jgi/Tetstr1/455258/TSEL_042096.t1